MNNIIYEKIEVLIIGDSVDRSFPNVNKVLFINASVTLSGNYIIFNTHGMKDKKTFESTPYHLDKIKGYKTS